MSGFCTEVGVLAGPGVKAFTEIGFGVHRSIFLVPSLQGLGSQRDRFLQSEKKPSSRELPQCMTFTRFLALLEAPLCSSVG